MPPTRDRVETGLGAIGGFELVCMAGATWRREFEATLLLRRHALDQPVEVEADLTPTGLIARLEHLIDRMPQDLAEQERKAADAERRLSGYRDRLGVPFQLQAELDAKRAALEALNVDLAHTAKPESHKLAA